MIEKPNKMFLFEDFIDDISLCDALIDYFHKNPHNLPKMAGKAYTGNSEIDTGKLSTDLYIEPSHKQEYPILDFFRTLGNSLGKYIDRYPYSSEYDAFDVVETVNIQHYKPHQGFTKFHTERIGSAYPMCHRHLVFMLYCNDVTDAGETQFLHQDYWCKAQKGKMVIWPSDWTFTHRGVASPTQEKTIVTGWWTYNSRRMNLLSGTPI